jgi:hypothetical protein
MRPLHKPAHKVRLTQSFFGDIDWWEQCLDRFNHSAILKSTHPDLHVFTDSCNIGAGMITKDDWACVNWAVDQPDIVKEHINVKETLAIVHAVTRWAPQWRNKHVVIHTHNIYARACINKGVCRNEKLMSFLRGIFWLAVEYNFTISCRHIRGIFNLDADTTSRLHQRGHLMYWGSRVMAGQPYQPSDLLVMFMSHMSINTWCRFLPQIHALPH